MNATPDEPHNTSSAQEERPQPEEFGPPETTHLASLQDGREIGDFCSKYSFFCWVQILAELLYLITALLTGLFLLGMLLRSIALGPSAEFFSGVFGTYPQNSELLVWVSAGLAGLCGGATSALKWLYHSVAKQRWHRDRIVWRIIVPPLSGVLSVFTGLMVVSGIFPFLNEKTLGNPIAGAAFGFFIGLFSDNALASLQKLAYRVFGTIDRTGG